MKWKARRQSLFLLIGFAYNLPSSPQIQEGIMKKKSEKIIVDMNEDNIVLVLDGKR